jgi:hypothetical protein
VGRLHAGHRQRSASGNGDGEPGTADAHDAIAVAAPPVSSGCLP